MSLLFDIPPEEPRKTRARANKTRTRAKRSYPPAAKSPEPEKTPIYIGQTPTRAIKPIGALDGVHECPDETCRASAHDIIHEDDGHWLIQCCFCHTAQWVPVIKGHLKEPDRDEFTFHAGRFAGMSISEVSVQARGLEYIKWATSEHKSSAVRAACKNWLDGNMSDS